MKKINLFLAGSPVEIVSGLACIAEVQPANPVFFIERNISESRTAVDLLMAGAASRFPEVSFRLFTLDRAGLALDSTGNLGFGSHHRSIKDLKARIDSSVQDAFGMPVDKLGGKVECVHFTVLHDYVRILLEACRQCPRAFYPHGFDHPRKQQIRELPFLFQPRGFLTALRSLPYMKNTTGIGEPLISTLYRLCGGRATCVPYDGTDKVYTFRQSSFDITTQLVRLEKLKETFQWLTTIPPWRNELDKIRQIISPQSVILLLSEYGRNPIWQANRHWADALLSIARAALLKTGASSLVIKAHPRSDGTAAACLHEFFIRVLPDTSCHLLPDALSVLPIEALALGLRFSAACSLGSCSLPGDIGIDVPHYTSPRIGEFFDQGWNGVPFWVKFAEAARMLIDENICLDLDSTGCV